MQEWTRFRGPDGTGLGTGKLPDILTAKNIRWRTPLPGVGHSSPVLWGTRVFVTSAEAEKGQRHLLCLDSVSGKELWRKSFPFARYQTHEYNTAASATPTVDGERIYALWPAPEAFVVTAHTHDGKEVWRRNLGAFPTQHGGASSPILVSGLLVFAREPENALGSLVALDPKTGETRWEVKRPSRDAPYSVPLVYRPTSSTAPNAPAQLIFASTAHGLTSVDAATGKPVWELPSLFRLRCVFSPILAGGRIIAGSGVGNGDRLLLALKPTDGSQPPEVAWKLVRSAPYVPTPVCVDGLLFLWSDGGILTCVRPESGEPYWQERVGGNFFGSPVFCEGKLFAVSTKGELVVVAAAKTYKLLSRLELGEPSHATPAIANGHVFVHTASQLLCIGS